MHDVLADLTRRYPGVLTTHVPDGRPPWMGLPKDSPTTVLKASTADEYQRQVEAYLNDATRRLTWLIRQRDGSFRGYPGEGAR